MLRSYLSVRYNIHFILFSDVIAASLMRFLDTCFVLISSRVRVLTTLFFVFVGIFVIRQWPDVRDIGLHIMRHLKDSISAK